jgi:DNA end-binding protein Ku
MAARATASGTISFGLVSVPVKLYTATRSQSLSFNLLHDKDKSRVHQQYICNTDGEVVERSAMVKGFEYSKDQYVVLTDEELKALERQSDQSIEIEEFVPVSQVDPVYFEKSSLLGPDKGGQKAYRLLCEALKKADRAAVARYSTRGKQQLVLLRESNGGLMMHSLFYADEVADAAEIDRGEGATIKPGELDLAVQLIEQLASSSFEPAKYEDEYRQRALALIEQKVAGQDVVATPAAAPRAQIIDLMEALKASLESKSRRAAAPAVAMPEEQRKPAKPARAKGAEATERKIAKAK